MESVSSTGGGGESRNSTVLGVQRLGTTSDVVPILTAELQSHALVEKCRRDGGNRERTRVGFPRDVLPEFGQRIEIGAFSFTCTSDEESKGFSLILQS